jgi:hypothetical protein
MSAFIEFCDTLAGIGVCDISTIPSFVFDAHRQMIVWTTALYHHQERERKKRREKKKDYVVLQKPQEH